MKGDPSTRDLAEVLRDEVLMRDRIILLLQEKSMTIPELSNALGFPTEEVTQWIMALWKYGLVADTGASDDGGYPFYSSRRTHGTS